ncbi:MAG: SBBP repeat-containing protein, partial [Bacteroidota bacterium]
MKTTKYLIKFLFFAGCLYTLTFMFTAVNAKTRNDQPNVISKNYGKMPLRFEANKGQVDECVDFISRGKGYCLFLTAGEVVMSLERAVVRMKVLGANPLAHVKGMDQLSAKSNYFKGNNSKKWHTNIPNYTKVKYHNIYPNIDLIYYGKNNQLEYDFVIAPGGDPDKIRLSFEGVDDIIVDEQGNLVLKIDGDQLIQTKPVIYYEVNGYRQPVDGRYVLMAQHLVGFEVAEYDASRPLVIDPVLIYSTFLGGGSNDSGSDIAIDGSGNVYIAGITRSTDFPTTTGAYDTIKAGPGTGSDAQDIFVSKLSPDGSTLIYSTYLGGSYREQEPRIAIDVIGNAYVTSWVTSFDFPTFPQTGLNAVVQPNHAGGGDDIVLTKLSVDGSALVYSTYLGASGNDESFGIAVDASGNAYVAGHSTSTDFYTTPGAFQTTNAGKFDFVLAKVNANATAYLYSTYFGGSLDELGFGGVAIVAIDASGDAYISGFTNSTNLPISPGAFQTVKSGGIDIFVAKITPAGNGSSDLIYSTLLGGSGGTLFSRDENSRSIAVDATGNAYVTGHTPSTDFDITAGAFQTTYSGGSMDAFVTMLNATGTALLYSTYLGGSGTASSEMGRDIYVDTSGYIYVTGHTPSTDFPITPDATQGTFGGGNYDGFVIKLNPAGNGNSDLVFSTFLGGSANDAGVGLVLDAYGNAYVTGNTSSTDFDTTAGAFQTTFGGGPNDAFVTKISIEPTVEYPIEIGGYDSTQQDTTGLIFDRFGNRFSKGDITAIGGSCWGGIFLIETTTDFNAEADAGLMETVICQVFSDISVLLVNSQCGGVNPVVKIKVGSTGVPDDALASASPYYIPCCGNTTGIIDCQVWKAINGGVKDPDLYDGYINVKFNLEPEFGAGTTWNFDPGLYPIGADQFDLYSVILHEVLHTLGFASLIDANGLSIGPATFSDHYSRFDIYLETAGGIPFIDLTGGCYSAEFNPALTSAVITSGCTNVVFDGSTGPHPVFAPTSGYFEGSSLSHFATNCGGLTPNYVMNPGIAKTEIRRYITDAEVSVLCDIGYQTTNTFGDGMYFSIAVNGCPTNPIIAGVNDGFPNTCTNEQYLLENCSGNFITIYPLANDMGTGLTFQCEQIVSGTGSITNVIPGTSFDYVVDQPGIVCITYQPTNGTITGNITCIRILVTPCGNVTCAIPADCNQICNGDFSELDPMCCSGIPIPGEVDDWLASHFTPRIGFLGTNPFVLMWSQYASGNSDGEGIVGYVDVQPSGNYIFSYKRRIGFGNTVNLYVRLVRSINSGLPFDNNVTTVPAVPIDQLLVLHELIITTGSNFEQVTVCFQNNTGLAFDMIWIYPEKYPDGGYASVNIDDIELIEDNFSAGLDESITCGDLLIGDPLLCTVDNITYAWTVFSGDGTSMEAPLDETQLLINDPDQTTTYQLNRTLHTNPGTVVTGSQAGCSLTDQVTVTVTNPVTATITASTNPLCDGNSDGTATVTPGGGTSPYFFEWNTIPVQIGTTAVNLGAGTYTVIVTDDNGCTANATVTLTDSDEVIAGIVSTTDETCPGAQDGSATVTASGGTPSYDYLWDAAAGSQTTPIAQNLAGGIYSVTVTDVNGCTATASATINTIDIFPQASFTITTTYPEVCMSDAANPYTFTNTSPSILGVTYTWQFGDGSTLTTSSVQVSYVYDTPGYFQVILTAEDACGRFHSVDEVITIVPSTALYNTNCCSNTQVTYDVDGDYTISSSSDASAFLSMFVSNELKMRGTLRIKSGQALTLNGKTIEFGLYGKIIVERTAILRLGNSTILTGLTDCGTMWQGIEVWGDKSQTQIPPNQGRLLVSGSSIISRAHVAVLLGKSVICFPEPPQYCPPPQICLISICLNLGYHLGYGGGMITAEYSSFENNGVSIKETPYQLICPPFPVACP